MQQERETSLVDIKAKAARLSHLLVILGAHAQFCLLPGMTVLHWHGESRFLGMKVAWWASARESEVNAHCTLAFCSIPGFNSEPQEKFR